MCAMVLKVATPVRNAEKTRPFSTCDFADRVFDSVVNKLTNLTPRFLENIKRNSEDRTDAVEEKNSDANNWDGSDAFSDKFSTFNELFGDTQTVCAGIVSYDSVKGRFLSEDTNIFVISPNRLTFYFSELEKI